MLFAFGERSNISIEWNEWGAVRVDEFEPKFDLFIYHIMNQTKRS